MLELSTLKFTVDTSQLEQALGLVNKLAPAMQGAATASQKMQKATEDSGKSTERLAKAAEQAGSKLTGVERSLERQAIKNKILRGETVELTDAQVKLDRAFTAGQAGQLATAKLSGATAEQFKKLASSFRDFNAISGANPFDKTLGGITKLRSEIQELASVNGLMNSGFNVTREQARLLQRDLNSLAQTMQLAGKSQQEIVAASKAHTSVFAEEANRLNNQIAIAKESEAQARKAAAAQFTQAKAYKALEAEMQRVDAVMAEMNNEFGMTVGTGERAAAAVAKYATMLKRAGIEGVQAAAMLETYRKKTQQIAAQDETRAATRLSRALTPQISDVAVSIAGGMPLHLVIMQQGLQIRDLIAQSGVSQQKMQEVFKTAGAQMVSSIAGTVKALGTLVYGTLVDAGKAVTDFGMKVTGTSKLLDLLAATNYRAAQSIRGWVSALSAAGIASFVVGIGAAVAAVVQLYKEQSKLNIAMNTTGAALGFTTGQANEYINKMNNIGVSGRAVAEALAIIGKEGGFAGKTLDMVVESAVMLESAAGIAIEETIKNFAKLRDDPVKAVRELGKETGYFSDELSTNIRKLEEQGNSVLAAELAMKAYAEGTKQSAEAIRNNYGFLETLFYGIGNAAKSMWDSILGIGRPENDVTVLKAEADRLAKLANADPDNQFLQYQAEMAASAYRTAKALEEQTKQKKLNAEASKQTESADKLILDTYTELEKYQIKVNKLIGEENRLEAAGLLTDERRLAYNRARVKAREDYDKAIKPKNVKEPYQWQEKLNDALNSTTTKTKELNAVEKAWADIQNDKKFLVLPERERSKALSEAIKMIKQADEAISQSRLAEYTKDFNKLMEDIQNKAKDAAFEQSVVGLSPELEAAMRQRFEFQKAIDTASLNFTRDVEEAKTKLQDKELQIRLQQLGQVYAKEVELTRQTANTKNSKDYSQQFNYDTLKSSATDVFGEQISGAFRFVEALKMIQETQRITAEQERANLELNGAMSEEYARRQQEIAAINASNQLASYASMLGGLKSFTKTGSKEYKALQKVEKALYVARMAMQIKALGVQLATDGKSIASSIAVTAQKGIQAVVNTLASIPFPANVAAGAAMIALIAGLGVAISGGRSSGGFAPTNEGKGTVFGDSAAESASIKNSLDYLNDVQDSALIYSSEMLKSLRNIESSMGGLTNLYLRSTGGSALAGSVQTGKSLTSAGKALTFINDNSFGGPLNFLSSISNGIIGSLFSKKVSITGQGISAGSQSLGNILSGGFQGQNYVDIFTKKKTLGFTTSTSSGTSYSALDQTLEDQFTTIFRNIGDSVLSASTALGLSTEETRKKLEGYIVSIGRIDLQGLSGEQIEERLTAVIGQQSDLIAQAVIPGFAKLQNVGEGYYQTLIRMASQLEQVQVWTSRLGGSLVGTGINAAIFADDLIKLFGGNSEFSSALSQYYKDFYTQEERTARALQELNGAFDRLGIALPNTKESYKQLVNSQDLTTEAGREMYAQLIQLAPVFNEVTSSVQQLSNSVQEEVRRLRGLLVTSSSVSGLEGQFATLTAAARAGDSNALKQLPEVSKALEAATARTATSAVDVALMRGWLAASLSDTLSALGMSVPQFAVGTNYVPNDMLAMVHEGEAIVPKAYNPMAGGSTNDLTLIEEVRGLRAEVRAVVNFTSKTARIMERVTPDGDSIVISTAE